MMKYICLVAVLTIAVTETKADADAELKKLQDQGEKAMLKCNSTSGISTQDIMNFNVGKFEGKTGCFIFCVATEFGVIKPDNTFDKAKVNKMLEPVIEKMKQEKLEEVSTKVQTQMNDCLDKQITSSDPCVAGKSIAECITGGLKKAGVIP